MLRSLALLCCIPAGSLAVADDHDLARLRIVRDLAAGDESLRLRAGRRRVVIALVPRRLALRALV